MTDSRKDQEIQRLQKRVAELEAELAAAHPSDVSKEPQKYDCSGENGDSRPVSRKAFQEHVSIQDALLESMSDGVSVSELNGNFLVFNRAARELMGLDIGNVPIDSWSESYGLFLPDGVTPYPPRELPLARALAGEEADTGLVFVRHSGKPDGALLSVSARPIRDASGQIFAAVAVFRDVTEDHRQKRKLSEFAEEVARSNRDLEDFAFVASHDLKEPLKKVQVFGKLLEDEAGDRLPEGCKDYIDRMNDASSRLLKLIDDLLAYSRISRGEHQKEEVCLEDVIRQITEDLDTVVKETEAKIELEPLPCLRADPTQMYQLLKNLIENALKFRREDGPPVIRIYSVRDEGEREPGSRQGKVHLVVEDNGIGFDEHHADRIFGVFRRLHGRRQYPGTGVGLAICRRIAERHGGTITARSNPAQGTRFTVWLPSKLVLPKAKPSSAA